MTGASLIGVSCSLCGHVGFLQFPPIVPKHLLVTSSSPGVGGNGRLSPCVPASCPGCPLPPTDQLPTTRKGEAGKESRRMEPLTSAVCKSDVRNKQQASWGCKELKKDVIMIFMKSVRTCGTGDAFKAQTREERKHRHTRKKESQNWIRNFHDH